MTEQILSKLEGMASVVYNDGKSLVTGAVDIAKEAIPHMYTQIIMYTYAKSVSIVALSTVLLVVALILTYLLVRKSYKLMFVEHSEHSFIIALFVVVWGVAFTVLLTNVSENLVLHLPIVIAPEGYVIKEIIKSIK